MNKTIQLILIPMLFIFAGALSGQDEGDYPPPPGNECPEGIDYYPPGEGEPGCMDYTDCNENGAFDIGEPCHDAQPPEGENGDEGDYDGDGIEGPPPFEAVDTNGDGSIDFDEAFNFFRNGPEFDPDTFDEEFASRDLNGDGVLDPEEFYAEHEEDHMDDDGEHEHSEGDYEGEGVDGPPPFEDADTNGDGVLDFDEAFNFFQNDPEFNPDTFDEEFASHDLNGDGVIDPEEFYAEHEEDHMDDDGEHEHGEGDQHGDEYGDHTIQNCMALAEGRGSYWIGGDEFAVWDDPNVDCGYILGEIGYEPPPEGDPNND